jgi:hypothetical protein
MSRTDKTRPWWVRLADKPGVSYVPVHDHRFGPCTLPDRVTPETASLSVQRGRCYWGGTAFHLYGDNGGNDGCRDCTGHHTRRADRRRSRHQSRRALHAYRADD